MLQIFADSIEPFGFDGPIDEYLGILAWAICRPSGCQ